MRYTASLITTVALLIIPLKCHGQSTNRPSAPSQTTSAKSNVKELPLVQVTLKNGQKVAGRSAGIECDKDCRNCHIEIIQKNSTKTLQQSDIAKVEQKRTFWQSVGNVTSWVVFVVAAPIWLPLIYFGGCN